MKANRTLAVSRDDPLAAFEAGRKLAPIEHLRAGTCLILG